MRKIKEHQEHFILQWRHFCTKFYIEIVGNISWEIVKQIRMNKKGYLVLDQTSMPDMLMGQLGEHH